jgi:hypothetical protein
VKQLMKVPDNVGKRGAPASQTCVLEGSR